MERLDLRIPLAVDALFKTDGSFVPRKVLYKDRIFEITRVLGTKKRCPPGVRAVAPVEYSVVVSGREQKIYYEAESNTWFSVREVCCGESDPAQ